MAENHTYCSFLKKLSIFLNGFIAMSGVALIGLGIYVKFKGAALTGVLGLSPTNLLHVTHLCLVLGCSSVLLGFVGWYGTIKESMCILLFYFLFMAVIITAESVIATVVLVFLPTVQQQTLEHSSAALKKSYRGYCEPDDYSMDWNLVMEKLKCCGVKNYTDFSGSSFEMRTGYAYPRSCCKPIGAADAIYQELPGILATLLLFAELG
ncbi:tetraspanin 16 [Phyllostomus discolor]|uniref:Tetraspanin n=1 Tax=Phyllostomus discolor TaxID=89673 RepID=A0A833ZQ77_9CHIR|nr:tetraspanin 16 [Phyllostomus discolor]